MNRSTAALIIAILLHLLIIALFVILGMLAPSLEPKKPEEEKEHRIKVSLKEMPKAVKDALVKNKIEKTTVAPPMPKGKQLEAIPQQSFTKVPPAPHKIPEPVVKPAPPTKPAEKTRAFPEPAQHIGLPKEAKKVVPVVKTPEEPKPPVEPEQESKAPAESSKLYSKLLNPTISTSQKIPQERSSQRESSVNKNIRDAYGDTFGELSAGQQKFILDNQEIMRRITQEVLNRVASTNIPDNFRVNTFNVVEFYLYPNGNISDITFIKRSGFYMLDDTTVETIQYAYGRYPKPAEKTLIRYKVGYYLQGY
jgi:TonB family protein